NRPKDAIAPLAGIIEADWSPYSFTMNWLFTRPGAAVRFEAGEPYCHIFPLRRGEMERGTPRLAALQDDPALAAEHEAWTASRNEFNAELLRPGSSAIAAKWQKHYYRGVDLDGDQAPDHRKHIRLRPFTRTKVVEGHSANDTKAERDQ